MIHVRKVVTAALAATAAVALCGTGAHAAGAQAMASPAFHTCYSQMSHDAGPGMKPGPGSISSNFSGSLGSSSSQGVEKVTMPSTCKVFFVYVRGGLYGHPGPVTSFNVTIYQDASGSVGPVWSSSASSTYTTPSAGVYKISLNPNDIALLGGSSYWLSVSANVSGTTPGNYWYWDTNSTLGLGVSDWQNPGGAVNPACPVWVTGNFAPCTNAPAKALEFRFQGN